MKTPWLVGAIVLVHCIAVGIVLLMPGCGTPGQIGPRRGAGVDEEVILPPRPAEEGDSLEERQFSSTDARSEVRSWPQETSMYVVAKGDSLSRIAARFDVSMKKLMALNGITNPDMIKIGQTLVIPGEVDTQGASVQRGTRTAETKDEREAEGGHYVVRSGDTLSEIAVDYGTTVKAIKRANSLKSDVIKVGQKLLIPGLEASDGMDDAETPTAEPEEDKQERQVEPVDLAPDPAETVSTSVEPETVEEKTAGSDETRIHIVGSGEDLKTIAMLWGASAQKLRELNDLGKDDKVEPGDRIKVPVTQY